MAARRRVGAEDSKTRAVLLDVTERLMLEEGYAAVSSRRVAKEAGLNAALVYYYFGTMDELFIALFRRGADRSLELQAQALASDQPLWALWELTHSLSNTALTMEFVALANHRKAIRAEIVCSSNRFRSMQVGAMSSVLEGYGVDPKSCPPVTAMLLMSGISRFLLMEEAFGIDTGHAETIALVERYLRRLEGERRRSDTRPAPHPN
jgi:AcrR family transcriptional regulator